MTDKKVDGSGLRYNTGKVPMSLVPASATISIAKVLEVGQRKYLRDNWRKGMSWNTVLDSLERHLMAFKMGQDYDEESGLRHIEHILCNVAFLNEYHFTCPQLDDRFKNSESEITEILRKKE